VTEIFHWPAGSGGFAPKNKNIFGAPSTATVRNDRVKKAVSQGVAGRISAINWIYYSWFCQ
jgi:hypothetical protein